MIADIFGAIVGSKYLSSIESKLGAEFLSENSQAVRMVWVPTTAAFENGNGVKANPRNFPKSPASRNQVVRVRVWGKAHGTDDMTQEETAVADIRATEALINRLIYACNECAPGVSFFEGVEWIGADEQEILQRGRCADVTLSFDIPVYVDDAVMALNLDCPISTLTTQVITTLPSTSMVGTADFPNSDVTGTPAP